MKKNLKKILMPIIILGFLFVPISPIFKIENGKVAVKTEINKTEAAPVTVGLNVTANEKKDPNGTSFIDVKITSADGIKSIQDYRNLYIAIFPTTGTNLPDEHAPFVFQSKEYIPNDSKYTDAEFEAMGCPAETSGAMSSLSSEWDNYKSYCRSGTIRTILQPDTTGITHTLVGFEVQFSAPSSLQASDYHYLAFATDGSFDITDPLDGGVVYGNIINFIKNKDNLSYAEGSFTIGSGGVTSVTPGESSNQVKFDFMCGFGVSVLGGKDSSVTGCIAELSYNVIFSIASWIAEGLGRILDFFVYYSTNSSSYTNEFVTKAFSAIRDIANIFFIIALLYVAIKTILNLNVSDNKKLIGSIVIIALLINFSLFFTEVIIDGSNILAKVFYNQISSVDKDGKPLDPGAGGEKSVSIGLIDKYDPQKIISGQGDAHNWYINNKGNFIFITLLAAFLCIYTGYIFLTVALLFVGRVVALWLAMIFAPLAFASYTIPSISNQMGSIGWKGWWNELLKNAFLAPIFIFFLYIVVMFANFLKTIVLYQGTTDIIQNLLTIVIPFIILVILLMKAKKMAVTFSGELGAAVSKMGKGVAGAAVGVAAGVAGFAGRKTVGHIAANLSEREGFRNWAARSGKFGKMVLQGTSGIASGSFDLRGVKIAGKSIASTGLKAGAVAGVGGFAKTRVEHIKREEAFADKLLDTSDYELARMVRDGEVKNLFEAKTRARDLNEVKRENYANQIQNAPSISKRSNLISASKIRKTADQQKTQAQIAATMAALATATPATTTTTTTTTTTPATPAVKP